MTNLRKRWAAPPQHCQSLRSLTRQARPQLPEGCFAVYRKNANLTNPLTSDARSVMLRIPLPEDDGFALALPVYFLNPENLEYLESPENPAKPFSIFLFQKLG